MGNFLLCTYVQWKSSWRHKLAVYEALHVGFQDYDGTVVVLSGELEYLLFRWNSIRDWTKVSSQVADFQVNQVNSTWGMLSLEGLLLSVNLNWREHISLFLQKYSGNVQMFYRYYLIDQP